MGTDGDRRGIAPYVRASTAPENVPAGGKRGLSRMKFDCLFCPAQCRHHSGKAKCVDPGDQHTWLFQNEGGIGLGKRGNRISYEIVPSSLPQERFPVPWRLERKGRFRADRRRCPYLAIMP